MRATPPPRYGRLRYFLQLTPLRRHRLSPPPLLLPAACHFLRQPGRWQGTEEFARSQLAAARLPPLRSPFFFVAAVAIFTPLRYASLLFCFDVSFFANRRQGSLANRRFRHRMLAVRPTQNKGGCHEVSWSRRSQTHAEPSLPLRPPVRRQKHPSWVNTASHVVIPSTSPPNRLPSARHGWLAIIGLVRHKVIMGLPLIAVKVTPGPSRRCHWLNNSATLFGNGQSLTGR